MIETHNLRFRYSPLTPEWAFPDVHCAAGERLLLLGASGSGKTTLLHLMSGLLKPAAGQIRLANTDWSTLSGAAADRFRGRHVGIVFQRPHFVQSLTVAENLGLPLFLAGLRPDPARVRELLEALGIGDKAGARPRDLSVGEQQRAGIARALVHRPAVVFADEPTSALDDRSTEAVVSLLEHHSAQVGASLLIVTHDNRLRDRYPRHLSLSPLTSDSPLS